MSWPGRHSPNILLASFEDAAGKSAGALPMGPKDILPLSGIMAIAGASAFVTWLGLRMAMKEKLLVCSHPWLKVVKSGSVPLHQVHRLG